MLNFHSNFIDCLRPRIIERKHRHFKNIYRSIFIVSVGYEIRQIVLHTKCRKLHRTNQMAIIN